MDWKYIPKKDKYSIFILIFLIVIFAIANFLLKQNTKQIETTEGLADTLKWFYTKPQAEISLKNEIMQHDLNTISYETLLQLCKEDTMLTSKIIAYRNRLRGFHSLDQLIETKVVDQQQLNKLKDSLCIVSPADSIYINTETFESLLQHPYLNYSQCLVITDIRDRKSPIKSIRRLELLDEFTNRDITRLKDYVSFNTRIK